MEKRKKQKQKLPCKTIKRNFYNLTNILGQKFGNLAAYTASCHRDRREVKWSDNVNVKKKFKKKVEQIMLNDEHRWNEIKQWKKICFKTKASRT